MKPLPHPPVEPGWYAVRSSVSPRRFCMCYTDDDVRLGGRWNKICEFVGPFDSEADALSWIGSIAA